MTEDGCCRIVEDRVSGGVMESKSEEVCESFGG